MTAKDLALAFVTDLLFVVGGFFFGRMYGWREGWTRRGIIEQDHLQRMIPVERSIAHKRGQLGLSANLEDDLITTIERIDN